MNKIKLISNSPSETIKIGKKISKYIGKGKIIFLEGNLGAGKTTLVKGIAESFNCDQIAKSPTFILITTYYGDINVNHCDFFRLNYQEEIFDLGLDEYLEEGPEIAKKYLPEPDLKIKIEIDKLSEKRNLVIYSQELIKI